MLNPIIITIIRLLKKIERLYLGLIFWEIKHRLVQMSLRVAKKVRTETINTNNNSNIYVFGFLIKKDWSIIFSITFAWTSTPGTVNPKGIFTRSNKPWADAPIKTYLSLKKLSGNLGQLSSYYKGQRYASKL